MGIDKGVMQQLMYAVLGELSRSRYKIVFKGSLLLSALMEEADVRRPSGLSRDFDGDLREAATVDDIIGELGRALKNVGVRGIQVQVDARTTETQFFLNVCDADGNVMFNADVGIRINPWHTLYRLKNGTAIYGQTIAKIFWDKICVVSTDAVNVRPWDVFDMYLLSLRKDLRMSEILAVREGTGRPMGNFASFLYPSEKLRSAWRRRRYVKNRPEFEAMFGRVRDLCTPFIWGGAKEAMWDPAEGFWYEGE